MIAVTFHLVGALSTIVRDCSGVLPRARNRGERTPRRDLERFKKYCSHSIRKKESGLFGFLASFRLRHRSLWTCFVAEASPKPKNPRSEWLHYFLKRSRAELNGGELAIYHFQDAGGAGGDS